MSRMARLGLFIVAALVLLFGGIFLIGNQQRLFSHSYRLRTQFPGVAGLLPGAEVRIGGVRQGTVESIQLPSEPRGQVRVTLSLDRSSSSLIKRDSLAAIETEGVLGNKYLAISFGSPEAPEARDWEWIASQPPLDMDQLFKKSQEIMETTHRAMQSVDTLASAVATLATRINRGDGTLGALMNDRTAYNQLNATLVNLAATSVQAKAGATAFQENMQALKGNFFFRSYFKDRGYQDAADLTRWEIGALPASAPAKVFTWPAADLFDRADDAKLKDRKRMNEVGGWLEKNPFDQVVIQAFAGRKGDQDSNKVLTQAQALVLRAYLAERFELDDARLKTLGMGETGAPGGGRIVISVYGR